MPTLLQSAFNTFQNYDIDIEKLTTNKFIQGYQTTLADLRGTVDWSLIDDTEAHKLATALGGKALGAGIEWFGGRRPRPDQPESRQTTTNFKEG